MKSVVLLCGVAVSLVCAKEESVEFKSMFAKHNQAAYIPSQCYTKTKDAHGVIHNPCFSCHINSKEPNYVDDAALQALYPLSDYTKTNRFTNLFKDRSKAVAAIDDATIDAYIAEDNYRKNNTLLLAEKLKHLPASWDVNGDGSWGGYVPDCYFDFDAHGFDKAPNGAYTRWRAFAYYPFLGTFWPTNGSTDDVLIRLHEDFAKDEKGVFDLEVYTLNLSIVEAMIKQKDITIEPVDEQKYGLDLDKNGILGKASKIVYLWVKPRYDSKTQKLSDFSMSYVGLAKEKLSANTYFIAPGLYPKGTEFLHTVRYLGMDDKGRLLMTPRIKEVRYAKKTHWNHYGQLFNAVDAEAKEKAAFPDRLRSIAGDSEKGLVTGTGWVYQGFIEDASGALRPQNHEETLYCMGCHGGIGATTDTTFAFARKFDANTTLQGWYHWSQEIKGFTDIPEPKTADGRDEYTLYLEQNHAGDEFRANTEVIEKFFDANGSLKSDEVARLHGDISHLIVPSDARARMLNKAYRVIVQEQSFSKGRDAHVTPLEEVHQEVKPASPTEVEVVEYAR
ncbi:MAG: hypothetical protein B7Y52_01755 [Sulfurovum sp. 28-43-6]|nr:MAG: hypothetical protein B7Y63_02465 [Sulfurovum sp. 35-42-20]OYY57255.1 MAG: hypothetical protein B7Y52_01755 [Sulfurovum sp. 28-43-6]OYZ25106.1 MAG: hypothetical protein B7Y23_07045 [Sulfurovum sp. 16-42-52]OYZ48948.1 MAG: hypothetical protein B7Y13_06255 [Sulfurovum sp. 24-42-9]OZA45086.1 MAG: hypothetical protein B7X80_06185 [Sulfurovum sp. 17-42-90]OZA59833.1 MAG: hypothetical protein B7X69_06520 [Sulfurovum sp. 39-42-12]